MTSVQSGNSFGLSSDFLAAAQHFAPSSNIRVFVEGFDDVSFWEKRFSSCGVDVEVEAYAYDHIANGKGTIIRAITDGTLTLGENLLVALDSDYDYLLDKNTITFSNKFVFQTYAYSIENLLWHPECLGEVCQEATCCTHLIDKNKINNAVLSWSKLHYPEFLSFLQSSSADTSIIEGIINNFKVDDLNYNYAQSESSVAIDMEFSTNLNTKGLYDYNIFLFMRGHDIEFIFNKLCADVFKKTKLDYINHLKAKHSNTQIIREYCNSCSEPETLVKRGNIPSNICLTMINDDIEAFRQAC